jgi:REP element-mobilizing transposase RayT
MEKFKGKYRIPSNRAQFWDYSKPADYFITINIANRECILGNVDEGKMVLSYFGKIVESEINKIIGYHNRIMFDTWVIMPNHIHLIVTLGKYGYDNGVSSVGDDNNHNGCIDSSVKTIHELSFPADDASQSSADPPSIEAFKQYRKQRRNMLIPKILGKFQHQTSKQINLLRDTPGVKVWQKDYHDHIIRDIQSYHRIKYYIINNPKNWKGDTFYRPRQG